MRSHPLPDELPTLMEEAGLEERSDWPQVREQAMLDALRAKFSADPKMQAALTETGAKTIIMLDQHNDPLLGMNSNMGVLRGRPGNCYM